MKKRMKAIGKRGRLWINARRKLKTIFNHKGIVRCEECGTDDCLGFAHMSKRRNLPRGDIDNPDRVVLLCNACHWKHEKLGEEKMAEELQVIIDRRSNEREGSIMARFEMDADCVIDTERDCVIVYDDINERAGSIICDLMNERDYLEGELNKTRKAQIDAELEAMTWKELVEKIEHQRSHVEGLLLALTAASQEYLMPIKHKAYVMARNHMCKVATKDKYERRLA